MRVNRELFEIAKSILQKHDTDDLCTPGILKMGQHGIVAASGLNDNDYQSLSVLCMGHKHLNQLETVNKIPIPSEILQHFKHIKCHCMMGLFPEIGRAWLTIDSEIYIWTYEQTRDVAYYDGLSHLIVSVGLIKPKAGIFVNDVKYLLLLTTPVEIIVLGVSFNDAIKTLLPVSDIQSSAAFKEMHLMDKPIFMLSTDNIAINVIKGSDNGRIFLGGRDGNLYEIVYQAELNWFGKRCKKVNHSRSIVSLMVPNFLKLFSESDPIINLAIDNSRGLLYLLTEKGSIEAWNIGQDFSTMRRIARITSNEIAQRATNIIKTVNPTIFQTIKTICPLSANDCNNLNLMAITQCGVRLFFATTPLNSSPQYETSQMEYRGYGTTVESNTCDIKQFQGIYLIHVRLPPGYTPNSTMNKPKRVHLAHYSDNTLLLVCSSQQDHDVLWSISSSAFSQNPCLTESTTILSLDGIVWSLAEIPIQHNLQLFPRLHMIRKPKKIVLLTNQGVHIISLLKPVDIMQQLLMTCNGPYHEAIKAFFSAQDKREACATAFLLACFEHNLGNDLSIWAAQALTLYGGEPFYLNETELDSVQQQQLNSSSLTKPQPWTAHYLAQSQTSQDLLIKSGNVIEFSAKHNGIYLCVARLLRPFFKTRCIDSDFNSILTQADCTNILQDLSAIRHFLEIFSISDYSCTVKPHKQTFPDKFDIQLEIEKNPSGDQLNTVEKAHTEEKKSLIALNYFIKYSCEVIGLWKILCEHKLCVLANQLLTEHKEALASSTFRDLILTQSELCSLLISALINSYLKDNASVSIISSKLRNVCPNIYRYEDAVYSKATEILTHSKNCSLTEERRKNLQTALQICKDAAPNLPLQNICQQFTCSGFYEGVIELSATCAAKVDPEELGIHFYNSNEPEEDCEGFTAYASRMKCYKEVHHMLDRVCRTAYNINSNQEVVRATNATKAVRDGNGNVDIKNIVKMALQVKDPLIHISVYEWLMVHEMQSELLELTDPTLGEFLRRSVVRNPDNLKLIDLLWKYYEKSGQHSQAARILDSLASIKSDVISLDQRIEYLARSVMCMRNENIGYLLSNGILLKELEDKLEIARVQKMLFDAMVELSQTNFKAVRAVRELTTSLYNVTQLYQNFADPFDLWECKLAILNCSHHNDPLLIETIWDHILNKTMETGGTKEELSTRLFLKVGSLVKEYGESGHCFPLGFLIRELEVKACQLKLSEGIVPDKLAAMNLNLEILMEYYFRMISMNERIWANEGNEWHLVESSIRIITLLANSAHIVWHRSRHRVFGKAQDMLSVCLNLCYQKPGTDHLQQTLKELQCRLHHIET